ncbi:cytochrome P450 [Williamsia sp.]|uniref:cytochrome P450 n=1 Tax=Williamsia sp. TaxID=1872085 RepID=UPI002F921628
MSTKVSHGAAYELRSGDTWRDPWKMYADLRDHDPVHRVRSANPDHDFWVLTRHADVSRAADDWKTFTSSQGLTTTYGELESIGLADNPPMVMQDPPAHTNFRKLVSRGFTPKQVTEVEPAVREFVRAKIAMLAEAGSGEIVTDLYKPLPSMVVAHYLGVPESDRVAFDGWTEAIVGADTSDLSKAGDTATAAVLEMMAYFGTLIEYRRTHPGEDTISHLVKAGVGEDDSTEGLLSILAFTFTMVAGGNDTTTGVLGGATELLAQNPGQRAALVEDPGLIGDAVDEFLRLTSPVQGLARTTTAPATFGDHTIPAGRKVLLCYGSANRDPRAFGDNADRLDVTRRPRQILTFSRGAHYCLGAAAARMQARVTLTELLARCPEFTVDPESITYAPGNYVRRPTTMHLTVGP